MHRCASTNIQTHKQTGRQAGKQAHTHTHTHTHMEVNDRKESDSMEKNWKNSKIIEFIKRKVEVKTFQF